MKKIAIIIDTLNGGGAEKVCLTLLYAMLDRGIDAHLIVLKRKCDYQIAQSNKIHFIFDDDKVRLYSTRVQKRAANRLIEISEEFAGFDTYISNLDYSHAVLARSNLSNCFYVVHNSIEMTLRTHRRLGPFKYWRKRRAINQLNGKRLITVSKGIKKEIENSSLIKAKDITTIYNPIELDQITKSSLEADNDIPSKPYIIFMGRIAKQKRVDILLKAFQHVKADVELVVLTSNLKKFDKLVKQYNSNNRTITGISFKQNPYPLVRAAQSLVLSSDYEGLGMVLVEALACGTSVASTDCPHGPNEIMTGELAGFLAPVNDPVKLASKIDASIEYKVKSAPFLAKVDASRVVEEYLKLV